MNLTRFLPSSYFRWLQHNNPTSIPDSFPELSTSFETSVKGLYCIGDLTGIPLINQAADSGHNVINILLSDASFTTDKTCNSNPQIYDLIIVGAGPSGISASLQAKKNGLNHLVLEASEPFTTISNFPAQKPIYISNNLAADHSGLVITDGTKETLLSQLTATLHSGQLPIKKNEEVKDIIKEQGFFSVISNKNTYKALRVIIAIGKTGNSRKLNIPGENLPKVYNRLIDAGAYTGKNILIVGGGDAAIEAAIALANKGNFITLSYRKEALSRPKDNNLAAFEALVKKGSITPLFSSQVKNISPDSAVVQTKNGEVTVQNDLVFSLIGTQVPKTFFRRTNIRMEKDTTKTNYLEFFLLLFFAGVLYFGKAAPVTSVHSFYEFLQLPVKFFFMPWAQATKGILAYISLLGIIISAISVVTIHFKNPQNYFASTWKVFKYCYFTLTILLFSYLYCAHNLLSMSFGSYHVGYWYTSLYSLTIVIFGMRRIYVHPTGYIKRQTYTLMFIQVFFLFLLPIYILPALGKLQLLSPYILNNVFPNGSYWRSFGFILAWPLFMANLATQKPVLFWLILGLIQTFVIIPFIVYKWGKGAYCGWICSCGGLAETLGDEYRTQAPHGPLAKKIENSGQIVLFFSLLVTAMALSGAVYGKPIPFYKELGDAYYLIVDIFLAGVLGVGVYFFMSARIWCRFFCPLAALMHIYARFSVYRIFSNKKRCISCSICTKVCHMGIDVMNYANKGIPLDDVQCVRCSACIINCPMQVLTFGNIQKTDLNNTTTQNNPPLPKNWWSGLFQKDLDKLTREETKNA